MMKAFTTVKRSALPAMATTALESMQIAGIVIIGLSMLLAFTLHLFKGAAIYVILVLYIGTVVLLTATCVYRGIQYVTFKYILPNLIPQHATGTQEATIQVVADDSQQTNNE
jgi:hypothetical protein